MAIEFGAFEVSNRKKINKPKFGELNFIADTSSSSEEIKQFKANLYDIKQLLAQNQSKPDYNTSQYEDKNNVECYFCKNKGYFKSECEMLKAKLECESQNQFASDQYKSYGNQGN